jgi:hypothetical protein
MFVISSCPRDAANQEPNSEETDSIQSRDVN